jgi:hypothetical protein
MTSKEKINHDFEEIAENYIIPSEIEPILKNAIDVRIDVENSFSESEKEVLPYLKIKSSIDSHIAEIIKRCQKR